jgi:anti-anti-sigma factor
MADASQNLVSVAQDRGVLVLTINAPAVDEEESAGALRQELCAAVANVDSPRVAVNFQPVKFISTACLRALLAFRLQMRQKGGQFLLCGMSEDVADVFYSTHMGSDTASSIIPFALAPDVAAAVAYLAKLNK